MSNTCILSSYQSEEFEIIHTGATNAGISKLHSKTRKIAREMLQNLAVTLCTNIVALCGHRQSFCPSIEDFDHAIESIYQRLSNGRTLLDPTLLMELEDDDSEDDDYDPESSTQSDDESSINSEDSSESFTDDFDTDSDIDVEYEDPEDVEISDNELEMNDEINDSQHFHPLLSCFGKFLEKLPMLNIPLFNRTMQNKMLCFLLLHLTLSFQSCGESLFTKLGNQPLGLLNTIYWLEEDAKITKSHDNRYSDSKVGQHSEIRQNMKIQSCKDDEVVDSERSDVSSAPGELPFSRENFELLQSALKSEQEFKLNFMKKEQRLKLLITKLHEIVNDETDTSKPGKRPFSDINDGIFHTPFDGHLKRKVHRSSISSSVCSTDPPKPSTATWDLDNTYIADYDANSEPSSP